MPVAGTLIELVGPEFKPQPEHLFPSLALFDGEVGNAHLSQLVKLQGPLPHAQQKSS